MRTNLLTPAHQAFLAQTTARNKSRFGGFFMEGTDDAAAKAAADAAAAAAAAKATEDAKAAEDAKKKFEPITSQEEFDRRLAPRLTREREKYADYDDLKAAKTEYDKLLEAAKTDQEKAVEAAKNEGKTEVLAVANTRLINAEARALAAAAGFRNPQIAVSSIDLSKVTVGDDGAVDAEAIKTKLTELATAEPYLVDDGKSRPKPDHSQGGGGGGGEGSSLSRGRDLHANRRGGKKTS